MNVVKATVKGQILIPASLRRKYKLKEEPLFVFMAEGTVSSLSLWFETRWKKVEAC